MTVVDTCHCMFVKTQEHTTPRVNLNVNSRVWVIMMVSVDSSIVTNVPLCWGILIVGELWGGRRLGHILESLCFLLIFPVNPKLF